MERLPGYNVPVIQFKPLEHSAFMLTAAKLVKNSSMGATMDINEFHRGQGGHKASRAKLVQMAKLLGIRLTGKLRMCEACHVGLLVKTPISPGSEMVVPNPGYLTILYLSGPFPFPVPEGETGFLYLGVACRCQVQTSNR